MLLNIAWLILGGLILGILYLIIGILYCCTLIGIPLGLPLIKISMYIFCPFGRTTEQVSSTGGNLLGNIIWLIFGGLELAIVHCIVGAVLCCTFIGIPLGMKHFEIAKIALTPFGRKILSNI